MVAGVVPVVATAATGGFLAGRLNAGVGRLAKPASTKADGFGLARLRRFV